MNNKQFIIHGVPAGHQVWGTEQKQYFETFYGSYGQYNNAHSILVVETRKNGSGMTSYYTFIRPRSVSANDGRPGAYFGMTLSVDGQYCTDVNSLYHLFEQVFAQKMVGRILAKTGESEKFAVDSFASVDTHLSEVSEIVLEQIGTIMAREFEDIDGSFTKSEASRNVYYNLNDVDSETFVNATKLYGKVYVSSEYLSKDAQIESLRNGNRKVTDQQKEYENRIVRMQDENGILSGTVDSLKGQLQEEKLRTRSLEQNNTSLKNDIETLRREKGRLNERISEMKRSADVDQLARRLEPSLSELLKLLKDGRSTEMAGMEYYHSHSRHSGHSSRREGVPFLIKLLINALAGLVLLIGGAALATWKNGRDAEETKCQMEELQSKYESRTREYEAVKVELESLKASAPAKAVAPEAPAKAFTGRINVRNYNGGYMKLNKEYVVEIVNSKDAGMWEVEGADVSGDQASISIKVAPNAVGKLSIRYLIGGKAVAERTFNVEE